MLSAANNEILTQVGPGTPGGELLREYWHPIETSESVSEPGFFKPFELLGERLVMYRNEQDTVEVVADHIAPLPSDPDVNLPPYAAREEAGLVFVSLRHEGPPPFPLWDILAREDGGYRIDLQEPLRCNWFQIEENTVDTTHTAALHAQVFENLGLEDDPSKGGFSPPLLKFGFQPYEQGIVKSWTYEGEDGELMEGWGNPLVFPNIMRIETEMHYRVPVNDTETKVIILAFELGGEGVRTNQLPGRYKPDGTFTMADFYSQDAMAWETQGLIADRTKENLGASDIGIVMFRRMFMKAIEAVKAGRTDELPARGNGAEIINQRLWMDGYLPMSAPPDPTPTSRLPREEIFDGRHREHVVPPTGHKA